MATKKPHKNKKHNHGRTMHGPQKKPKTKGRNTPKPVSLGQYGVIAHADRKKKGVA